MKTIISCTLLLLTISCLSQTPVLTDQLTPNTVIKSHSLFQTFTFNKETLRWQKQGNPFYIPDTLTRGHAYKWKREQVVAVQDLIRVNGKWEKYGEEYPTPDTLTKINLIVR